MTKYYKFHNIAELKSLVYKNVGEPINHKRLVIAAWLVLDQLTN
jgi:hypothetical protein